MIMTSPYKLTREYRQRILQILSYAELPMDVNKVRTFANIANWECTKSLLLELVVEGRIKGLHTSRGWVFWREDVPVQQLQH